MKYEIIFFDKTSIEVNKEQRDKIIELSSTNARNFEIKGNFYTFSDIKRITELQESEYKRFSSITDTVKSLPEKRKKKARENIIKGFKKHFRGREIPANSQIILNHFLAKTN